MINGIDISSLTNKPIMDKDITDKDSPLKHFDISVLDPGDFKKDIDHYRCDGFSAVAGIAVINSLEQSGYIKTFPSDVDSSFSENKPRGVCNGYLGNATVMAGAAVTATGAATGAGLYLAGMAGGLVSVASGSAVTLAGTAIIAIGGVIGCKNTYGNNKFDDYHKNYISKISAFLNQFIAKMPDFEKKFIHQSGSNNRTTPPRGQYPIIAMKVSDNGSYYIPYADYRCFLDLLNNYEEKLDERLNLNIPPGVKNIYRLSRLRTIAPMNLNPETGIQTDQPSYGAI
jgi:hypothetical protein